MRRKTILSVAVALACILSIFSCHEEKKEGIWDIFPSPQTLSREEVSGFHKDSIAVIEGLDCDGENLVLMDFHEGMCYTLFDAASGDYIGRFGTIGQGPGEIENMCAGYLSGHCYIIVNGQTRRVQRYSMDSLRAGHKNASPVRVTEYAVPDLSASALAVLHDSLFLAAGTYRSSQQYCLFTKDNSVVSSAVDIYNKDDDSFNDFTRQMSNQGLMAVHPTQADRFAYVLLFSSNLDILTVNDGKISVVSSRHYGNPDLEPKEMSMGGMTAYTVDPNRQSPVGYLDICASDEAVFALYSDETFEVSRRSSRDVLVFDWDGNPMAHYTLDADVYHIAVDPQGRRLYAAARSEIGESVIYCYGL